MKNNKKKKNKKRKKEIKQNKTKLYFILKEFIVDAGQFIPMIHRHIYGYNTMQQWNSKNFEYCIDYYYEYYACVHELQFISKWI